MKIKSYTLLLLNVTLFLMSSCNDDSKKSVAKNNIDSCTIAKPFEDGKGIESMVQPGFTGALNNYWGNDTTKLDFQHQFENGKLVRSFFYYENGKVQEEYSYQCGSLHGPQKYFYENGQLARMIPYRYGYRQGTAEEYDEKGVLREQVFFEADSLIEKPKAVSKNED